MEFILFIPLALSVIAFTLYLLSWWRKEEVIRYNMRTRFHFDNLGNPQYFFDAITLTSYEPEPGNKAFPDPIYFVNNSQASIDKKTRHTARIQKGSVVDSEFVVETGEEIYNVKPIETPAQAQNLLETSEKSLKTVNEIADFLTARKQEGKGKVTALGLLGIKPGKNKEYITWGNFYDNIEVR